MTERPADLPDFKNPPVTEVVLGVQFNSIERFVAPHLGLFWSVIAPRFGAAEEHPPIAPTFETFGQSSQILGGFSLDFPPLFGMPRAFFIDTDRRQLLQVQRDRFLHNWRKIGDGDAYPRFEAMLATFEAGLRQFSSFIEEHQLGAVEPNQCEVTYINHVPLRSNESAFAGLQRLFESVLARPHVSALGLPEDARLMLRYVMRSNAGAPIGRLIVSAEPARRSDGTNIIQLNLTARGAPAEAGVSAVIEFLKLGRRYIVNGFAEITNPVMHAEWERQK
jgi:uncharacterized protein (TIGR04255 family)